MPNMRTLPLEDIFHDLQVVTEASMIVRSNARMEAIRRIMRQQGTAMEEAIGRIPLMDQLTINDIFTGMG